MAKVNETGSLALVYVTAPSGRAAERLGSAMVEEGLAACANVIGPIRSVFRWRGRIERAREAALILKTRTARVAALTRRIKALHSYAVPCVVALPIVGGNADFLAWVAAESAARKPAKRTKRPRR